MNYNPEADEIDQQDLEAAADLFDRLTAPKVNKTKSKPKRKTTMPTIKARIIKAKRVLKTYRDNHPDYKKSPEEPDYQAIGDMVSDLMHLYKNLGHDPEALVRIAKGHFDAEHRHEDEPGAIPWTVIGLYDDTDLQITADGVEAKSAFEAFTKAMKERAESGEVDGFKLICAFPGTPQGFEYADSLTDEQINAIDTIKAIAEEGEDHE